MSAAKRMIEAEPNDLGKSLGIDAATVEMCAALLEFRAIGVSPFNASPVARALRDAGNSLRALLLQESGAPTHDHGSVNTGDKT